jgi:DNA invertase Pin-like site-specific DNA recombinase
MDTKNQIPKKERTLAQIAASKENGKKGGRPKNTKIVDKINTKKNVVPELNRKAYSGLARSASNLNQIAKSLNMNGMSNELAKQIYQELLEFRLALIGAGEKV